MSDYGYRDPISGICWQFFDPTIKNRASKTAFVLRTADVTSRLINTGNLVGDEVVHRKRMAAAFRFASYVNN